MPNPQQPELRRNDKGAATDQDQREVKLSSGAAGGGNAHGTDAGDRGGGEGGGTPPDQQTVDERIAGG